MLMAKWRRQPQRPVMIHSDQGSQFGSNEFSRWCKENNLTTSMSRRGNCYDNAVAESFFSNLQKYWLLYYKKNGHLYVAHFSENSTLPYRRNMLKSFQAKMAARQDI